MLQEEESSLLSPGEIIVTHHSGPFNFCTPHSLTYTEYLLCYQAHPLHCLIYSL